MEWFKNAIGEENYNSLGDETISKLKGYLKNKKFVEDDKSKWIEKHVFNEQRQELKEAKTTIEEYKKELEGRNDLITSDEHKLQLLEAEKAFSNKLKDIEATHKLETENNIKRYSLINLFSSNGSTNPEFMLNNVQLEDVILKDGKVQNGNEILDNMKKNVPNLFNSVETNIPNSGGSSPTTKEQLIKDYNKHMEAGNVAGAMNIQRQIKELK